MRDSFLAVDAATDVDARARSWSRTRDDGLDDGLDATRLHPRAALGVEALDATRSSSPLRHTLPTLRRHLGAVAEDAEHVVVVCDAVDRVL